MLAAFISICTETPHYIAAVSPKIPVSVTTTTTNTEELDPFGMAAAPSQKTEVSYLRGMGIDAELTFSTLKAGIVRVVPRWASFLMWLGWWLRMSGRQDRRVFSVIIAPSRNTAALLAAFGAQLAGAQNFCNVRDWQALTLLPLGTEVFIQQKKNGNKSGGTQTRGVIQGVHKLKEYGDQEFVVIKGKDGIRHLSVNHLHQFTVTLSSVGERTKTAVHRHGALFKSLIPGFDQNWFVTPSIECVIAGEVASLQREGQLLLTGASPSGPFFSVNKILGIDSAPGEAHAKVGLISSRNLIDEPLSSPLCILDGAAGFRSLEHCLAVTKANTILAILDRVEFDAQFHQRVLTWIEGSHIELLPDPGNVFSMLPSGIECSIAAIPVST